MPCLGVSSYVNIVILVGEVSTSLPSYSTVISSQKDQVDIENIVSAAFG